MNRVEIGDVAESWAGSFCLGCDTATLNEPYCSLNCRERDQYHTPTVPTLSHQYENFQKQGCLSPMFGVSPCGPQLLPGSNASVSAKAPQAVAPVVLPVSVVVSSRCVVTAWRQRKTHDYQEPSTRAETYDKLSTCLLSQSTAFCARRRGQSLLDWDVWARRSTSLFIEYDDLLGLSTESLPLLSLQYSIGFSSFYQEI